jgi:hypothetical protein
MSNRIISRNNIRSILENIFGNVTKLASRRARRSRIQNSRFLGGCPFITNQLYLRILSGVGGGKVIDAHSWMLCLFLSNFLTKLGRKKEPLFHLLAVLVCFIRCGIWGTILGKKPRKIHRIIKIPT